MAEVLGIDSSIAGLASLVIQLSQISFQFSCDVKRASKSQSSYLQGLSALTSVLLCIQQATNGVDSEILPGPSISRNAINKCHKQLESVKARLEKRLKKKKILWTLKNLSWPFEEKETRDLVAMLHRYHSMFVAVLTEDIL
jgi:hypothetical protein